MKHLFISLLIFSLFLSCTPARKETKLIDHLLNPDYKLAYQFRENNVSDSSYYYYNKAKDAFYLFDYIHTLDNEKLAKILSSLENNSKK